MALKDIKSMMLCELKDDLLMEGIEGYRANQIYEWISKGAYSFEEMTDISLKMRQALQEKYCIYGARVKKKLVSKRDGTVKYLFLLFDGAMIEAVLMRYEYGYSVCISTQVGCKMGCSFCATGKDKFIRNLQPSEMLSQIQEIQKDNDIRVHNVVLMGMGEPLDNYDNVLRFLRLASSKDGMNIGMRHITVSSCGLVDKIYKLAEEKLPVTLSVSLHAPSDYLREKIMPINKKWKIKDVIEACRYYVQSTGRRISFEYAMIKDFNDSKKDAQNLSELLNGLLCHVNLIPINSVDGTEFKSSELKKIKEFCKILNEKNVNTTIRRTLGPDINASCGQLRQRENFNKEGLK